MTETGVSLGIELGSTQVKAVLIDASHQILAQGSCAWRSHLEGGYWSYSLSEIRSSLQHAYACLRENYFRHTGTQLQRVDMIGISAMMHGYLPFDCNWELLTPFRTWQNTSTGQAAENLTSLFDRSIPLRWSIAHLEQAILNGEAHVPQIAHLTTLAGYVHYLLTEQHVLGICDASGMFPIDAKTLDYDAVFLARYEERLAPLGLPWTLRSVLPRVLCAGADAGSLTTEGARLLDPSGFLPAGIPLAPPEGDAATGMVATNSIRPRTGNVSVGTSVFLMAVLDHPLLTKSRNIDLFSSPDGLPAAMVHCNNGTLAFGQWVSLFGLAATLLGGNFTESELYETLLQAAEVSEPVCGGLTVYPFAAGEPIVSVPDAARCMLLAPGSVPTLGGFFRAQLYSCFAALRIGTDALRALGARITQLTAHGGLFKTPKHAQRALASALKIPVDVLPSAAMGGAYGMALLCNYRLSSCTSSLADYLDECVFPGQERLHQKPSPALSKDFEQYLDAFQKNLSIPQTLGAK